MLTSEEMEKPNTDGEERAEQSWWWPFESDGVASWRAGRWLLHQGWKEMRKSLSKRVYKVLCSLL